MAFDPSAAYFLPGTFDPTEYLPEDEMHLHQGGLDNIAPALDPDIAWGFDPADLASPSLETELTVEKRLPQWGPPFIEFVDHKISHLEQLINASIRDKWQYESQTIVTLASVQTTANGALDQVLTPNCIIFQTEPGFTFALHRLIINVINGVNNAGNPLGQTQTPVDNSISGSASAISTQIPAVAGETGYITGFEVTSGGATAATLINVTLTGLATNLQYTMAIPAGATSGANPLIIEFPQPIPASAVNTAITLSVGNPGAGNTNITAAIHGYYLSDPGGYWELRVGNDMIDNSGPSMTLPSKLTYGTRDAPRCRDGEIMSLFMSGGPPNTQIRMKIQGTLDRVIEG